MSHPSATATTLTTEFMSTASTINNGVTEELKEMKTVFLILLLFLNFIGNTSVITVVLKDRELKTTPRNITLASLSFSDLLMVFVISFRISTLFSATSGLACQAMAIVFGVLVCISILHLFVLSIDSYVAVFYPLSYRRIITLKRLAIVLGAVWFVPVIAIAFMPLIIGSKNERQSYVFFYGCVDYMSHKTNQTHKTLTYVNTSLLFVTPLISMIVVYLRIAKVSWYQSTRVGGLESRYSRVERTRAREMKWAKTIGTVIGALTVCYLPIIVLQLYQVPFGVLPVSSQAIQFLAYIHTVINPVVYSLRSRDFRKALLKICKRNNSIADLADRGTSSTQMAFGGNFRHGATSSDRVIKSSRRRNSLWVENENSTTSSSFTIFTPMCKTQILKNILNDLIETSYSQANDESHSYPRHEGAELDQVFSPLQLN